MSGNRTLLPLPLHCYDEAGRVLPPKWLHWAIFWNCRALLLLAGAFMLGPQGDGIPALFYPSAFQWTGGIVLGALNLLLWLLIGRREWLWQHGYSVRWIKPGLVSLLTADIALQMSFIVSSGAQFSLIRGICLLLTLTAFVCVIRSKHIVIMLKDWRS